MGTSKKKSKKEKIAPPSESEDEQEIKPQPKEQAKEEPKKEKQKKTRTYDANKVMQRIKTVSVKYVEQEITVKGKKFLFIQGERDVKGDRMISMMFKAVSDSDKLDLATTAAFLKGQDADYQKLNRESTDKEYTYLFKVSDGHKDTLVKNFNEEFRVEDFLMRVEKYIMGKTIEIHKEAFSQFYTIEIVVFEKSKNTQKKRAINNIKNKMKQQEEK